MKSYSFNFSHFSGEQKITSNKEKNDGYFTTHNWVKYIS